MTDNHACPIEGTCDICGNYNEPANYSSTGLPLQQEDSAIITQPGPPSRVKSTPLPSVWFIRRWLIRRALVWHVYGHTQKASIAWRLSRALIFRDSMRAAHAAYASQCLINGTN